MTFSLYNHTLETSAPAFDLSQTIHMSLTSLQHPLEKATIIDVPFKPGEPYKLQISRTGFIIKVKSHDILPYNPESLQTQTSGPSIHNPLMKHKAKCTVLLTKSMTGPTHGITVKDESNWRVLLGHTLTSKSKTKKQGSIPLPKDIDNLEQLLESGQLVKGWHNSKSVITNIEN